MENHVPRWPRNPRWLLPAYSLLQQALLCPHFQVVGKGTACSSLAGFSRVWAICCSPAMVGLTALFAFISPALVAGSDAEVVQVREDQANRHGRANQPEFSVRVTSDTLGSELTVLLHGTNFRLALVSVPAGPFQMGGRGGDPDELPAHQVYLDAFWIGKYEVTVAQYAQFLNESGRDRTDTHLFLDTENTSAVIRTHDGRFVVQEGRKDYPVGGVTWYGAEAFFRWLRARTGLPFDLPTEAQWEKAAHGKSDQQRIFPWGVRLNKTLARYRDTGPAPVGQFPAGVSPFGAYDMTGNVAEWVRDWYDPSYYGRSPSHDPEGPTSGTLKILRGGDWTCEYITIPRLRSADRDPQPPDSARPTWGLRVALEGDVPGVGNRPAR